MGSNGWVYPLGNAVIKTSLRLFANFRAEGGEAVPPYGPLLVVSNHMSYIDPALLALSIPRRLFFLAKREPLQTPLVGPLLRRYGAFPIDRMGRDVRGFRWALERLAQDQAMVIFPEGTRSPQGLRRPIPGVVQLHLRSGAPILPVAITGTEHLRSLARILFPSGDITVRIGAPFTLPMMEGGAEKAQLVALADMVMQRIADLLPESYRGVYAGRGCSKSPQEGP